MPVLAKLIDAYAKKRQRGTNVEQDDPAGQASQNESSFGRY